MYRLNILTSHLSDIQSAFDSSVGLDCLTRQDCDIQEIKKQIETIIRYPINLLVFNTKPISGNPYYILVTNKSMTLSYIENKLEICDIRNSQDRQQMIHHPHNHLSIIAIPKFN